MPTIKIVEIDPDLPVDVYEQGRLCNLIEAQVTEALGFAHSRFSGRKVWLDWTFTAQVDDAEPVICAIYDRKGSADDRIRQAHFYTYGPDVVFRMLFGASYTTAETVERHTSGEVARGGGQTDTSNKNLNLYLVEFDAAAPGSPSYPSWDLCWAPDPRSACLLWLNEAREPDLSSSWREQDLFCYQVPHVAAQQPVYLPFDELRGCWNWVGVQTEAGWELRAEGTGPGGPVLTPGSQTSGEST